MKITIDHPASSYGIPVILDDAGNLVDYAPGIRAIRAKLGLNTAQLGSEIGVSGRTIENWEQGRAKPNAQAALLIHLVDRYPDTVKRLAAV